MTGAAAPFHLDPDGNYRAALFDSFLWLAHGFGTRRAASVPLPLATVKQIHSAEILQAGDAAGVRGEADALLSDAPGLAVGVRTADCVPLLLVDPVRRVVAAIHAGWRGTVAGIAPSAVERMRKIYGTDPRDVYAACGPSIGLCCFEVGPEVARQFAPWHPSFAGTETKEHVDLAGTLALQLLDVGLAPEHLAGADLCTVCGGDDFYSYRRERDEAGRMISWIGIR